MRKLLDALDDLGDGCKAVIRDSEGKGYNEAMYRTCGVEHALGEIIAKAVRYRNLGDVTDLYKIVTWVATIHGYDELGPDEAGRLAPTGPLPGKAPYALQLLEELQNSREPATVT